MKNTLYTKEWNRSRNQSEDFIKDYKGSLLSSFFFFLSGKVSAAFFPDLCSVWGDAPVPEEKGGASEENVGEGREGNDRKDEKKQSRNRREAERWKREGRDSTLSLWVWWARWVSAGSNKHLHSAQFVQLCPFYRHYCSRLQLDVIQFTYIFVIL